MGMGSGRDGMFNEIDDVLLRSVCYSTMEKVRKLRRFCRFSAGEEKKSGSDLRTGKPFGLKILRASSGHYNNIID
jgi:hypothetical protein